MSIRTMENRCNLARQNDPALERGRRCTNCRNESGNRIRAAFLALGQRFSLELSILHHLAQDDIGLAAAACVDPLPVYFTGGGPFALGQRKYEFLAGLSEDSPLASRPGGRLGTWLAAWFSAGFSPGFP